MEFVAQGNINVVHNRISSAVEGKLEKHSAGGDFYYLVHRGSVEALLFASKIKLRLMNEKLDVTMHPMPRYRRIENERIDEQNQ